MKKPSRVTQWSSEGKRLKVLLIDNDDFSDYTSYFARGLSKYADINLYLFSEKSPNVTGAADQKNIKFNYVNKWLPKGYSSVGGIIRVFILYFILIDALLRTKLYCTYTGLFANLFFIYSYSKTKKKTNMLDST